MAKAVPLWVVSLFFVVVEVSSEVCFPVAAENMQDPKASRRLDSEEGLGSVCIGRCGACVVHVFHHLFEACSAGIVLFVVGGESQACVCSVCCMCTVCGV